MAIKSSPFVYRLLIEVFKKTNDDDDDVEEENKTKQPN